MSMSMWNFVTRIPVAAPSLPFQDLPIPMNTDSPDATASANRQVEAVLLTAERDRKRKMEYAHYSSDFKLKVGRYAIENGTSKAVKKYSQECENGRLNESTI